MTGEGAPNTNAASIAVLQGHQEAAQTLAKGGLLVEEESVRWREATREALLHMETKPRSLC